MGDHLGTWAAAVVGLLIEGRHSEDVVHVTVRVHHGAHRSRTEPGNRLVQSGRRTEVARVDEDHAVARVEGGHVGERGKEAHPVTQAHQFTPEYVPVR